MPVGTLNECLVPSPPTCEITGSGPLKWRLQFDGPCETCVRDFKLKGQLPSSVFGIHKFCKKDFKMDRIIVF